MFKQIVVCPWKYGQKKDGVDIGAFEIENILKSKCINENFTHIDYSKDNETYNHTIFDICSTLDGNRLTIGGDHSIGVGSVLSSIYLNKDTCVIWIDAHPDINTYNTSFSKNVHGMPVSFLTGLENAWSWVNDKPILKFENLYYFGIRDCDEFETNTIKNHNISVFRNITDIINLMESMCLLHKTREI